MIKEIDIDVNPEKELLSFASELHINISTSMHKLKDIQREFNLLIKYLEGTNSEVCDIIRVYDNYKEQGYKIFNFDKLISDVRLLDGSEHVVARLKDAQYYYT
jgi:hypothetical protein